jgi:hypothetical protein
LPKGVSGVRATGLLAGIEFLYSVQLATAARIRIDTIIEDIFQPRPSHLYFEVHFPFPCLLEAIMNT